LKYILHNGKKVDDLTKVFGLKYNRINLPLVIMMRLSVREHMDLNESNFFGIAYQEVFEVRAVSYYLEIMKYIMNTYCFLNKVDFKQR